MKEQAIGLKIAWVKRWINSSESGWKNTIKHTFPLKNNDFWSCNLMERDVWIVLEKYKRIPYFWKDVIKKWADLNFYIPNKIDEIINQPLWLNSLIRNEKKRVNFNAKLLCKRDFQNKGHFDK